MKYLLQVKKNGYLLFSLVLFLSVFQNKAYSQCTLNATISGNTSVCTGSTTLTADVTGASSCNGTETLGLFYSLDDCTNPQETGFSGSFPTTVANPTAPCNITFDPFNRFFGTNQDFSCTASFGGMGAENSITGMCTHGYNGSQFCGDGTVSNNCGAGFFLRVYASSVQPAQISKLTFYMQGVTQSNSVACTKLGIRINQAGTPSVVYHLITGISIPRSNWVQYTIDLSSVPGLTINSTGNAFDIFFQGYAPDGTLPNPLDPNQTEPMFELDQIRLYYTCAALPSSTTYSWTGPNGFTSTQQSITATTAGTYYVTVTDCQGCSVTKSVVVTDCAICSISSVSATPSTCNSSTNTYSISGWVDFTNPPSSGTLTVSDGTATQTFYAPFYQSFIIYTHWYYC